MSASHKAEDVTLKPCPFCGSEAIAGPDVTQTGDGSMRDVWIECENCAALISYGYGRGLTDEVAFAQLRLAWNNRVKP